jgi:cellulose biosynthesis protein BcsQ
LLKRRKGQNENYCLLQYQGGGGKTAAAVNLAYLATSREGSRTLVLNLDPQGAASFYFRIKPKINGGVKKLIGIKRDISGLVKATDYANLDLIPTDFSFRNMDLLLEEEKNPTLRLRKLLKNMNNEYDYAFLDCPPSISLVSENVFQAADALLVPTIPSTLSLRTLDQLLKFCRKNKLGNLKMLSFFSMVDSRKLMHLSIVKDADNALIGILRSVIPYASDVEKMGLHRAALASYTSKSRPALAYEFLREEIKQYLM